MVERMSDDAMRSVLDLVAPGTPLRAALDDIISARTGALIVIGDEVAVLPLCDGGFDLGAPFTSRRLFELSKMDGAIILDAECTVILRANVHLQPDPSLPTAETGMRHRTAERLSRQTRALVISISQRRDVVTLYLGGGSVVLEHTEVLLAKANQALQTLARYRAALDEVSDRLSAAEFDGTATVVQVAGVIRRHAALVQVARWVERYIAQLGTEGRLVRMQSDELMAGSEQGFVLLLRDYSRDIHPRRLTSVRGRLLELAAGDRLDTLAVAGTLGLPSSADAIEATVVARGYRSLAQIPMLPSVVQNRLVERFGSLPALCSASIEELDEVEGVGARRAEAIRGGLRRARERVSR